MASYPEGHHDWHSQKYVEEWISADAPHEEERKASLRRVVQLIPCDLQAKVRVLDVGAGYGPLTQQVLALFPNAEVVLHDFSEAMFSQARQRLADEQHRVSYVISDLHDPSWPQALPGPFDAVVSSRAIHNVFDPARIRAIYGEILPLVKPGGCFLNYDQVTPASPIAAATYRRFRLLEQQQRIREETGEERSLEELEAESRQRWGGQAHGHADVRDHPHPPADAYEASEPATLENQLRWLREAGFDEAECFWKDQRQAAIGGYRHS